MSGDSTTLDGQALRDLLAAGAIALRLNVEAVNALNVFPVPDGDTGTNMLLTLRAVQEELARTAEGPLDAIARAAARGSLLGARGNSGVIFSQFLRGLAQSLEGCAEADGAQVAQAFAAGAAAAYKAVSKPVEGTLLTVLRSTSEAMVLAATDRRAGLLETLEAGLESCKSAVLLTREQLDVLKAAGVVDAGGQGFALVLEGGVRHLRGEGVEGLHLETAPLALGRVQESFLTAIESDEYGYCIQLLVRGKGLDLDALRGRVSVLASSTVVVGDDTLVKIHAHAFDPGPVLSAAVAVGSLGEVKIENIDQQHQEFQTARRHERPKVALAVVAVAWGEGLQALFRKLGAQEVVTGGQSLNPSCQELLEAAESVGAEATLLLPNNANVVPAAQQAAEVSQRLIRVVPTCTIPQGVAAMLAYNPERDPEANVQAMAQAAASVRTGEVVTAVRKARINGLSIKAGQVIGTLEGALIACGASSQDVLEAVVNRAQPASGSLITLFWGGDTRPAEAEQAAQRLRQQHAGAEVEVVQGGQPYYHYLVSIE